MQTPIRHYQEEDEQAPQPSEGGGLINQMEILDLQLRKLGELISQLRDVLQPILVQNTPESEKTQAAVAKIVPRTQLLGRVDDMQSVVASRQAEITYLLENVDL